jgi:hypothetical protein
MGRFEAINNIFSVAVINSGVVYDVEIATENVSYDPRSGVAYISTHLFPLPVYQATLGSEGVDMVSGLFQISVNYPADSGMTDLLTKVDELNSVFKSGAQFTISPYWVNIRNVSNTRVIVSNGFATIHLTIDYFSHIQRL